MRFHISVLFAVISLWTPDDAGAQARPAAQPALKTFTFDHYLQKDGGTTITELSPGEEFRIVLAHTCERAFEYSVYRSPHVDAAPGSVPQGANDPGAPVNPVSTVTKGPIAHESQWGSYILQVARKNNAAVCDVWVNAAGVPSDPPADALEKRDSMTDGGRWVRDVLFQPGSYVVAVSTNEWDIGADAALLFTPGVDRKFTTATAPVATGTPDPTRKINAADTPGQSAGRISFGTLTHF